MAVAEASLRTSILLTSFGLISARDPIKGIPSSTISGLLSPVSERSPRIRICIVAPGLVEVCDIATPAKRPCKACEILDDGMSRSLSPLIETTEPVTASFRCIP